MERGWKFLTHTFWKSREKCLSKVEVGSKSKFDIWWSVRLTNLRVYEDYEEYVCFPVVLLPHRSSQKIWPTSAIVQTSYWWFSNQHSCCGKDVRKTFRIFNFYFFLKNQIFIYEVFIIWCEKCWEGKLNNIFKTHLTLCEINVGFRTA